MSNTSRAFFLWVIAALMSAVLSVTFIPSFVRADVSLKANGMCTAGNYTCVWGSQPPKGQSGPCMKLKYCFDIPVPNKFVHGECIALNDCLGKTFTNEKGETQPIDSDPATKEQLEFMRRLESPEGQPAGATPSTPPPPGTDPPPSTPGTDSGIAPNQSLLESAVQYLRNPELGSGSQAGFDQTPITPDSPEFSEFLREAQSNASPDAAQGFDMQSALQRWGVLQTGSGDTQSLTPVGADGMPIGESFDGSLLTQTPHSTGFTPEGTPESSAAKPTWFESVKDWIGKQLGFEAWANTPIQKFDLTGYAPCKSAAACPIQGGPASWQKGPDGTYNVRTLDDFRKWQETGGKEGSPYVTGAADPTRLNEKYMVPEIKYRSPLDGEIYTLKNVPVVVHDKGSAFIGRPNKLDVAFAKGANSDAQAAGWASGQPFLEKAGAPTFYKAPPGFNPMAPVRSEVISSPVAVNPRVYEGGAYVGSDIQTPNYNYDMYDGAGFETVQAQTPAPTWNDFVAVPQTVTWNDFVPTPEYLTWNDAVPIVETATWNDFVPVTETPTWNDFVPLPEMVTWNDFVPQTTPVPIGAGFNDPDFDPLGNSSDFPTASPVQPDYNSLIPTPDTNVITPEFTQNAWREAVEQYTNRANDWIREQFGYEAPNVSAEPPAYYPGTEGYDPTPEPDYYPGTEGYDPLPEPEIVDKFEGISPEEQEKLVAESSEKIRADTEAKRIADEKRALDEKFAEDAKQAADLNKARAEELRELTAQRGRLSKETKETEARIAKIEDLKKKQAAVKNQGGTSDKGLDALEEFKDKAGFFNQKPTPEEEQAMKNGVAASRRAEAELRSMADNKSLPLTEAQRGTLRAQADKINAYIEKGLDTLEGNWTTALANKAIADGRNLIESTKTTIDNLNPSVNNLLASEKNTLATVQSNYKTVQNTYNEVLSASNVRSRESATGGVTAGITLPAGSPAVVTYEPLPPFDWENNTVSGDWTPISPTRVASNDAVVVASDAVVNGGGNGGGQTPNYNYDMYDGAGFETVQTPTPPAPNWNAISTAEFTNGGIGPMEGFDPDYDPIGNSSDFPSAPPPAQPDYNTLIPTPDTNVITPEFTQNAWREAVDKYVDQTNDWIREQFGYEPPDVSGMPPSGPVVSNVSNETGNVSYRSAGGDGPVIIVEDQPKVVLNVGSGDAGGVVDDGLGNAVGNTGAPTSLINWDRVEYYSPDPIVADGLGNAGDGTNVATAPANSAGGEYYPYQAPPTYDSGDRYPTDTGDTTPSFAVDPLGPDYWEGIEGWRPSPPVAGDDWGWVKLEVSVAVNPPDPDYWEGIKTWQPSRPITNDDWGWVELKKDLVLEPSVTTPNPVPPLVLTPAPSSPAPTPTPTPVVPPPPVAPPTQTPSPVPVVPTPAPTPTPAPGTAPAPSPAPPPLSPTPTPTPAPAPGVPVPRSRPPTAPAPTPPPPSPSPSPSPSAAPSGGGGLGAIFGAIGKMFGSLIGSLFGQGGGGGGSSGGGGASGTIPPTPTPTPPSAPPTRPVEKIRPVVTLIANPSTVGVGATSKLIWASVGTTLCTVTDPLGAQVGESKVDGSAMTGPLATSTEFSVSCTVSGGSGIVGTTSVRVK